MSAALGDVPALEQRFAAGLEALNTIGGSIRITSCNELTDITGLTLADSAGMACRITSSTSMRLLASLSAR